MMEQLGIINLPDPQAKVGYVTKDINKDFNEYHLDKLKKLYYTVTKSIDFNDEVFKSNSSGEARKWQIIALEAKTNTKEQYFKEGLKEAAETMSAFIKFRDKLDVDVSKLYSHSVVACQQTSVILLMHCLNFHRLYPNEQLLIRFHLLKTQIMKWT